MKLYRVIVLLLLFFFKTNMVLGNDQEWESHFQSYFAKNRIHYLEQLRFFTYLYTVQNEAINFTPEEQNALIAKVTKAFFPEMEGCEVKGSYPNVDHLFCKYLVRIRQEEMSTRTFHPTPTFKQIPLYVQAIAKWIPWVSPLPKPPPPLPLTDQKGWEQQIGALQALRVELTKEQWNQVHLWVGHHGPGENWRLLANQYMEENKIPLPIFYLVRALLSQTLYDGMIAEMDAKYTYCIPRPYMMFPEFKPLIKKLKTPSYPSGHGIQGGIVATILSYFFPEATAYWHNLDVEGANTRLWAGVHFPEDIEQGRILGKKIAEQSLQVLYPQMIMNKENSFLEEACSS